VLIELNYEPEIRKEQARPQADAEDFVEAREKIATAEEKSGSPHMRG
jgi:hypothetical protein